MRTSEDLTRLVKASGFPLQTAIDSFVSSQQDGSSWKVLYREHGWTSPEGEVKFIDLVLEDRHGTSVLVLECKRVLEADWVFLSSTGQFEKTLDARVWVSCPRGDNSGHFGYFDARADPESERAAFCVMPGQDGKSRPMLERTAAETLLAVESLAAEEWRTFLHRTRGVRIYAPVIITTARLHISEFDPANVSLDTGEPLSVQHRQVSWVRFRKQFSSGLAVQPQDLTWNASQLATAKETEVLVVNAAELPKFLSEWSVVGSSLRSLRL